MAWSTVSTWDTGQEARPTRVQEEDNDEWRGSDDPYDEREYRDPDYYDDSHLDDNEDDYDEEDDSDWNRNGNDLTEENEEECFLERMGIK